MRDVLEGIFGKGNISLEDMDCLAYSADSSQIEGKTKAIVWPTRKEQIIGLVKEALKNNWDIVPRGGGSGMAGGCVPQDSIILDMSKMNDIGNLDKNKRTLVVDAGVILDDLNSFVREHGLFFPVNPTSHMVCSIGGMVATDAAGNRAIKYGKTSDWVEGIEIIDGRGNVLNLKGAELKDFAGTEGILGIITSIKLKLTEPITEWSLSLLRFTEPGDLIKKVNELKDNKNVISIEFFDRLTAELSGLEGKFHLFIEYGTHDGQIKDEKEIRSKLKTREDVGTILSSKGYVFMEDPKIPMEKMHQFMNWLDENKIPYFGHIALGIIHQRFNRELKNKIPEMYDLVQRLGGSVSGEHGIGIRKKNYLGAETIKRLGELKRKYDPENVINRGKIL